MKSLRFRDNKLSKIIAVLVFDTNTLEKHTSREETLVWVHGFGRI